MRLDQLEKMRRSPVRDDKSAVSSEEMKAAIAAAAKNELTPPNDKSLHKVGGSATAKNELKIVTRGAIADLVAAEEKKKAASVVTPTNDDDNDPTWKHIDEVETLVFCFQENEDTGSPSLEVIWIKDDHEYFIANDVTVMGGGECSEKFVPLIQRAAVKAKRLTSFMVRYNNELDRTWPYTKVSRVAEVVSGVKGMDVKLDSVDADYNEYIVNLVPRSGSKKKTNGNASFARDFDFSHIEMVKKYYTLDYIGGVIDLMEE